MIYDLAIIGGGPAGVAAGVYASRKRLKTILITEGFGGQSIVSENIQNWIGTPSIKGEDLAKNLESHLRTYAEDIVDIRTGSKVKAIEKADRHFRITTEQESFEAKTMLVASGSHRRKLEVVGAEKFEHKGITYCASCDGPLFADQDVAVVGGGNSAFESAAQLLAYCKSVTLLNRGEEFRADPITVKKVLSNPRMRALQNAVPIEVKGDTFVSSLVYENRENREKNELPVSAIFVEIGSVPTTSFVKGLVDLNAKGHIIVNPKNQQTSVPGIWAAGDCTDGLYHQNNIAAGDAVKALEDIYVHLHAK